MSRLISETTGYAAEFDTLIPELNDIADIREAFIAYHFGVENFNSTNDVPAQQSIHGHIESFKTLLQNIESNAVVTLSPIPTQISLSASTGFVTIGLTQDVEITNNLTVENDMLIQNDLTVNNETILEGPTTTLDSVLAKKGINIFNNAGSRNSSINTPLEGVLAYTSDNDQISIYTGTAWVGIENHGTLGGRIDSAEVLALLGL